MALGPVGQIHISVTDLDHAVEFYRDVLGIPLMFTVPGQSMAFFSSGDGVPENEEFRSKAVIYFHVEDIEAEHERLTGLGVAFHDKPHIVHRDDTGELWMSAFTDPDGHYLVLMQQR